MESSSKHMCIHISDATYDLLDQSKFNISPPDVMEIKGKGTMTTYWVHGRK
ncbi:adenylate/guanylate cyclase [Blyttiomyces helicus]|uniref:Adenylate/guanylate cyclase n=1 Tax=Blyttiomyces helicus TaxID=388810 RepID=A0A4V1IQM6_9FUNG|nr:adenylate/guanylate cyclase [Blyttiomyces helicus]|eukprot:RKO87087.1 adenylate/guanylate cyclase [Blyttiomyces helicus]